MAKPKLKVSEADVQQAVVLMLELDGWRSIRTHPQPPIVQRLDAIMLKASPALRRCWLTIRAYVMTHTHAESFGEPDMPDYLFIRYGLDTRTLTPDRCRDELRRHADVMWIEFKAPGKRPSPEQGCWHDAERKRGALVLKVDSIDDFREWYKTSGLMRNRILS